MEESLKELSTKADNSITGEINLETNELITIEERSSVIQVKPAINYYNEHPFNFIPKSNSKSSTPNDSRSTSPINQIKPRKHKVAGKSILKASSIQSNSKFNLRRDLGRLISNTVGILPFEELSSENNQEELSKVNNGSGSGFWENAMKRINVVTTSAVAVGVSNGLISDVPIPITMLTPSRGITTSSSTSTSSFATILSPSSIDSKSPPQIILPVRNLKRVLFRMSNLKIIYPINSPKPPIFEKETRIRINEEFKSKNLISCVGWNGVNLLKLYQECCLTREEPGIATITQLLKDHSDEAPRVIDLSNQILSAGAIEGLSDLLSVDFGLKKLVLEGCGIDDQSIKSLLHSLLVSANVPTLSLASNKKMKLKSWKLIATFIKKAKFLKYLDLSENYVDKKSSDYLVQALTFSNNTNLSTNLAPPLNESLNDITNSKSSSSLNDDDDDSDSEEEDEFPIEPLFSRAPLLSESIFGVKEIIGNLSSLRLENCGLRGTALESFAHGVRSSNLKHISLRRNKINMMGSVSLAIMIRDYSITTYDSSIQLSTQLNLNLTNSSEDFKEILTEIEINKVDGDKNLIIIAQLEREKWKNSQVGNKLRKQIDELPRTGSLLTLDVKDNDIKGGIVYIAQVLKRNRTLKVLNLSDNKIDQLGLISIAEALKYNSCLETLDLSGNPCCGPSTEGIIALRSALTINTSLVRLFLRSTNFSTDSAIALAEFLPEFKHLLHLDLTENVIEIAGILGISISLQMNLIIRCLDMDIAPNDPEFSHLSQDVLQACIRNTELAQTQNAKILNKSYIKSHLAVNLNSHLQSINTTQITSSSSSSSTESDKIYLASSEISKLLIEILITFEDGQEEENSVDNDLIGLLNDLTLQAELAEIQLNEIIESKTLINSSKFKKLVETISSSIDSARKLLNPPISLSPKRLFAEPNEVLISIPTSEVIEIQSKNLILEEGRSFLRRNSIDLEEIPNIINENGDVGENGGERNDGNAIL